jgi:hypothetical protein
MWLDHMLTCISLTTGKHRILINYDSLLEEPKKILYGLSRFLEFKVNPEKLNQFQDEFLDKDLRHHAFATEDLTDIEYIFPIVSAVYKELLICHLQTAQLDSDILATKVVKWQETIRSQKYAWNLINYYTEENENIKKQLAERDRELAERDEQLSQIWDSKAWRFVLWLRKLRLILITNGK